MRHTLSFHIIDMRLIDTYTRQIKDFFQPPRYAILSHRWGHEEVSYEEYCLALEPAEHLLEREAVRVRNIIGKLGYAKIYQCCDVAKKQGHHYLWIDTCCIDKRNSAEWTEAINSMWRWYELSDCCYVYLVDVPSPEQQGTEAALAALATSKWFTRSWTLQELLAPGRHIFCTKDWNPWYHLEKGSDPSHQGHTLTMKWARTISEITAIPIQALLKRPYPGLSAYSIAQKMSWAAKRKTTRIEDAAYSLLGLFDVHMPLLYGEGNQAFQRLQQAIINQSNDESIFTWRGQTGGWSHDYTRNRRMGSHGYTPELLAPDASCFATCGHIISFDEQRRAFETSRPPFAVTNKGLSITGCCFRLNDRCWRCRGGRYDEGLQCEDWGCKNGQDCLVLNCFELDEETQYIKRRCVLILRPEAGTQDTYARVGVGAIPPGILTSLGAEAWDGPTRPLFLRM